MLFKISTLSVLISAVAAHMSIVKPCPRYGTDSSCPAPPQGETVDHNIRAPIATHDSIDQPICKHTTPYSQPVATWKAGESVTINFSPDGAAHGGGHCQFGLSYDGGKTFVVVHDELKYCFNNGPSTGNTATVTSYNIPLPKDLPGGDKVVFAWAWNNAIGNREFYMNCVDVKIEGSGSSFSGPQMIYPNYGPNSPFIDEFNGNYDTGLDLFKNRKQITVNGSGSSSPAQGGGSGSGNNSTSPSPAPGYSASPAPSVPEYTATPVSGEQQGEKPRNPQKALPAEGGNSSPGAPTGGDNNAGQQPPVGGAPPAVPAAPTPATPTPATPAPGSGPQDGTSGQAPPSTSPKQPTGNAPVSGGECSNHGQMQCSGTGFRVCVWGKYSEFQCPAGTACQASGESIICGFASSAQ
ncbi:hypothetical protein H4219_002561 [Mycoemilia scoparia]|uniref:Chitin-binding type-4 domain-containing protein n=1 Tax=Mycoemilia scoparia TaxID=417184 RepID=A0A9W7ZXD3_9FUNG|nr:hypothetical protein H4219_002561 [Mycoemilia scoparia]